jgi:hypothetical protein
LLPLQISRTEIVLCAYGIKGPEAHAHSVEFGDDAHEVQIKYFASTALRVAS